MRACLAVVAVLLAGCVESMPVKTETIEKPYPVYCEPPVPEECKAQYAVDRIIDVTNPVAINRAMQAELEERAACEKQLRAALKGCGRPK